MNEKNTKMAKDAHRFVDVVALRKLMIDKGFLTVTSLSDATGINRTTLGKILNGEQLPSSESMYRLAKALNIASEEAGNIFFAENLRSR